MKAELIVLGTGSSVGVPVVGCQCPVCKSNDPKNKRLRPSVVLKISGKNILIDAGPDFREQALRENITDVAAVLLTHLHFDHIMGMDDLKTLSHQKGHPMDCYLAESHYDEFKTRFYYLFEGVNSVKTLSQFFTPHLLEEDSGSRAIFDFTLHYFSYFQKGVKVNGFRIGDLSYVTDLKDFSNKIFEELKGTKILFLNMLRLEAALGHLGLEDVVEIVEKVRPEKCYLTHISHAVDHQNVSKLLPKGIFLAYDGMKLAFEV